jgi:hypothetical protein
VYFRGRLLACALPQVFAPGEMPFLRSKGQRVAGDPVELLVPGSKAADAFEIKHSIASERATDVLFVTYMLCDR